MSDSSVTLHSLIMDLDDEIKNELEDLLDSSSPEDRLHEMADGAVPIYYTDLASCLLNDLSLAYVEDDGLLPKTPDVWKILSISIYERLLANAHTEFEKLKTEYEELVEECEAEGYEVNKVGTEYVIEKATDDEDDDGEAILLTVGTETFTSEFQAWKWLEANPE